MKVSVLVPVFNEETTVLQILEEVNKQNNEQYQLEIIAIDDASTDNSLEILKSINIKNLVILKNKDSLVSSIILKSLLELLLEYFNTLLLSIHL